MKLPTYQATYKKDSEGVFAISLVNDPATQEVFVALANQEIKLAEVNKEQRILMGLVLQPDQLIYRNQNGKEFNIVFSSDTIKELSHNFFKNGFQLNSKLEHDEPLTGVTFVESWIVENPKIDKSANFGMEYPKGSWIATMKVDNDEVWNDYVKTGKVKGFSVDAMIDLKEINLNTNIIMEKTNAFEDFKIWCSENILKKDVIKMGEVKSGDIVISFDGESLEVGSSVYIMEGEEKVALPDGDYETENGKITVEAGVVTALGSEVVEEAATETGSANDAVQAIKSLLIKYSEEFNEKIDKINVSLSSLNDENEKLKDEIVEMGNAPAAKPIQQIQQVELNAKGRLLSKMRNK